MNLLKERTRASTLVVLVLSIATAIGASVWVSSQIHSSQIQELTEAVRHAEERADKAEDRWERFDEETQQLLDKMGEKFERLESEDLLFRDKNGGGCRLVILGMCIIHN